ncbi:hypothetical protein H2204_004463 [Knufia peltigerae]|uniref:Uncharacterized protein n=1 Tax=Knufia peltigerae TaxID=1002370 RepID=A0AA38Y7G7_9EURO|nr:hypothetical protein H2204_004463 [Knufia peltigerae]
MNSPFSRHFCRSLKSGRKNARSAFSNGYHSAATPKPLRRQQQRDIPRTQTRTAKTYTRPPNRFEKMVIDARVQHPILFPFLLIGCFGSVSMLLVMAYNEYKKDKLHTTDYPPEVEERLRLALHYTHIQPDPETSAKYFLQAIQKAEEAGMDPLKPDALGIRIRFSQMWENFGHIKSAIEILDGMVKDVQQKVAEIDEGRAGGAMPSEQEEATRRTLLRATIQAKVKLASLYESDYMQDRSMAKQVLSDAVGLVVKETKDPQTNGFTNDNSAGMTTGEIAAMLSQMGDLYATTGEEANALQVYMLTLQPLRASCNGTRSCKEAQVLSNIASTMDLALKKPDAKINGRPATKSSLAAARKAAINWADQAIATTEAVEPEDRDDICELASLSARMTRADLLLESGDKAESQEAFANLLPILKEKNLLPLIQVAEEGLKRAAS